MQRLRVTNSNVPTISNTGSRISPYRSTGLYMEMHKLDYRRKNLLDRMAKIERERRMIEEKLKNLDSDMTALKRLAEEEITVSPAPEKIEGNTPGKRLKY